MGYYTDYNTIGIYPEGGATKIDENNQDWVAVYSNGASNDWDNVIQWAWVIDLDTYEYEEDGVTKESKIFEDKGLEAGKYEVRYFLNNTYDTYKSQRFDIKGGGNEKQLSIESQTKTTLTLNSTHQNNKERNTWIGIYKKDDSNDWENVKVWSWITKSKNSFNISNLNKGIYEARLFYNNSYNIEKRVEFKIDGNIDKTTIEITKQTPSILTLDSSFQSNQEWQTWIGIYKKDVSNDWENIKAWSWVTKPETKFNISDLDSGLYEARLFYSNSYNLEKKIQFKIGNNGMSQILGEKLFYDKSLSLTKNTSCATCHDPDNAFVDVRFKTSYHPVEGAVSIGDDGKALGGRNAPTAAYAMFSPKFHYDVNKDAYVGGQFYDGRAATLQHQAMGPPLDQAEMMMPSKEAAVNRIKQNTEYKKGFKEIFGNDIFNNTDEAFSAMGELIGSYESTEEFAPFDSKYDRYLECKSDGEDDETCFKKDNWTQQEIAGMDIYFNNPVSNCRLCHQLKNPFSKKETFSNYEYYNIGTPRNIDLLKAKGLPLDDVDHGIFGRDDIDDPSLDGAFRVPTLRNIAVTGPYMTNGVFKDLRTVLEFYVHIGNLDENGNSPRPINPETGKHWGEPNVKDTISFDILNILPALPDGTINSLEAFLETLTDKKYEHLLKD